MATYPCSDDPSEIIESIIGAGADADKLAQWVNGGVLEEVQLGTGAATPTIRNVVHLVKTAAATLDGSDVSGKNSDAANGGTTLRMLADRFGDIVNVKDFGAIGDGVADDAEAINAAMLAGAGKAIWFPAGTYLTSTGIRIPSNTAVLGSGEQATTVKLTSPYSCIDCITNDQNWWNDRDYGVANGFYTTATQQANLGNENIYLGYMTVDGNAGRSNFTVVSGAPYGSSVHFANVKNTVLEHVTGINGKLHCIDVSSSMYTEAHDNDATTVYKDGNNVTWGNWFVGGSKNVRIINCSGIDPYADDCITTHYSSNIDIYSPYAEHVNTQASSSGHGVEIDDGSYCVNIYGGHAKNCNAGIQIKGHVTGFPARCIAVDGFVSEGNVYNFMISHDTPDTALYVEHAHDVVLKNCVSINAQLKDLWFLRYHNCAIDNLTVIGDASVTRTEGPILITKSAYNCIFNKIQFYNVKYGNFGLIIINSSVGGGIKLCNITAVDCNGGYVIQDGRVDTAMYVDGVYGYTESNSNNIAVIRSNLSNFFAKGAFVGNIKNTGYAVDIQDNYHNTFNANEMKNRSIVGEDGKAVYKRAYSTTVTEPANCFVQRYGLFEQNQSVQIDEKCLIGFEYKNSTLETPPKTVAFMGMKKHGPGISWGLVFGTNYAEGGGLSEKWELYSAGALRPVADNAYNMGTPAHRVAQVCAANGTINTSDEREKDNVENPSDALMRAWGRVSFKVFQFKNAIEKKGAQARLHVGVVAQQVRDAFAEEGLDAGRYGLFCHDVWEDEYEDVIVEDKPQVLDEDGNVLEEAVTHTERRKVQDSGDRYGIRYEEALALECAYQRWRGEKRDARIAELDARLNEFSGNSPAPSGASPDNL